MEGGVQMENLSGTPAVGEATEGFTLMTFIHTMDQNKCINIDDETIWMLICCLGNCQDE